MCYQKSFVTALFLNNIMNYTRLIKNSFIRFDGVILILFNLCCKCYVIERASGCGPALEILNKEVVCMCSIKFRRREERTTF